MDPGIAVAVRDVEVALRRQGGVGTAVEWLAAHKGLGLARDAEGHQHLAVEGTLAHGVDAVIGQPDRVVRTHMNAMRPVKDPFAPCPQQIAFGIEDGDRMLAAIEGIDPILPVDADRCAVAQGDFVRHLRPILVDLEGVLAASEPNRHASSPLCCAMWPSGYHSHGNANQASAARGALSIALMVSRSYDAQSTSLRREQEEPAMAEKLISGDNHID